MRGNSGEHPSEFKLKLEKFLIFFIVEHDKSHFDMTHDADNFAIITRFNPSFGCFLIFQKLNFSRVST